MTISFTGIRSPYYNKEGIYIFPINKDLTTDDIDKYQSSIRPKNKIGSGCNGDVYAVGSDLVIKRPRKNALTNKNVQKETNALDTIYNLEQEHNIKLDNIQSGIAAFEYPNGDSYLVSTFVKGKRADAYNNPFNENNIDSLMNTLTILDKGSKKDGRIMLYDINLDNINITPTQAGIFDFEYMRSEKLDELIQKRIIKNQDTTSTHISDTSNLESNVRSFEYAGLYYYFQEMPEDEASELMKKYLSSKSKYHSSMSDYYHDCAKTSKYPEELLSLSESEHAHSQLLSQPTTDIIKSEAIKIQMANFVFVSGKWCQTPSLKFNPDQIINYYQNGLNYFRQQLDKAVLKGDIDRITYYQNCVNLFDGWDRILKLPKIMNSNQCSRTTNTTIKTLDEIVKG